MYNPSDTPPEPSSSSTMSRNARYTYLVARLRGRQITIEEATEMFNLLQAALARSESGRMAALAQVATGASIGPPPPPPPQPATSGSGSFSDDFLLVGLLTMGVNAGLLAAITRKLQDGPANPPVGSPVTK